MLSTEKCRGSEDGGRREGGEGLGWERGRWILSSPTNPTPNQPLFISFSLPLNVMHSK